ncbi:Hypothetical protein SCF082_LOCUS26109, partial [Durusdinium trenchii]
MEADEGAGAGAAATVISDPIRVGDLVSVEARTYPGINKQGGVGRVERIHGDATMDVKFVLGGRENNVEARFVHKETNLDNDRTAAAARSRRARRRASAPPLFAASVVANAAADSANEDDNDAMEMEDALVSNFERTIQLHSEGFSSGFPAASATQDPGVQTCEAATMDVAQRTAAPCFTVGQIVQVEARTQPGVNKHGGTGRVVRVNGNGSYDVKYVLGGGEKGVEARYVSASGSGDAASESRKRRPSLAHNNNKRLPRDRTNTMSTAAAAERTAKKARVESFGTKQSVTLAAPPQPPLLPSFARSNLSEQQDEVESKEACQPQLEAPFPATVAHGGLAPAPADPRVVARHTSFRQIVSKVFRSQQSDVLEADKLLGLINVEYEENASFSPQEFEKHVMQLDLENRVMIRSKD